MLLHWGPVYPAACCTLQGLRSATCAQCGKQLPEQGGEWDLPVPGLHPQELCWWTLWNIIMAPGHGGGTATGQVKAARNSPPWCSLGSKGASNP